MWPAAASMAGTLSGCSAGSLATRHGNLIRLPICSGADAGGKQAQFLGDDGSFWSKAEMMAKGVETAHQVKKARTTPAELEVVQVVAPATGM